MNKVSSPLVLVLTGTASLLAPMAASAQFGGAKIVAASAAVRPSSVARGGKGVLSVTLSIKPQFHVNANKPNDPAYIPTVLTVQPMPGIVFSPARYPAAKLVKVSYSPKPLLVYAGRVTVTIPFIVTKTAGTGVKMLTGSLAYQGCDANSCFPPTSTSVRATVTVR